jgi:hypothetical protein
MAALPLPARADDVSTAEVLFREARELIARHAYADACPKLEESQRLDAAPGTEFNLARCYELIGRLASAWGAYVEVANVTHAAGQFDREASARERVAAVEPRLSFVTVTMRGPPTGVALTRDGVEMALAQLEVAIPIDPGEHVLRARAPGKRDWETRFRVDHDGQRLSVEVPLLDDEPPPEAATPAASPFPPLAAPPARDSRSAAASPNGERIAAGVILGASAIALGVGTYSAIEKVTLASRAWTQCKGNPCSTSEGLKSISDSNTFGDWATGSFIAFGVLAATAGVLWFTAPKPAPRSPAAFTLSPAIAPSGAALTLRGAFE